MKILNTEADHFPREAKAILNEIGQVTEKELEQEELIQEIADYEVLIVRLGLLINKELIDRAKNLKYIVSATTGLDHIDLDYAKEKGILVLSLKGEQEFLSKVTATAELAWGLLLGLSRRIPWAFEAVRNDEWIRKGKWLREDFEGHELVDKTLGIIGLGRLGRLVAAYGKAFGMKVLAHDPYVDDSIFAQTGAQKSDWHNLITKADYISVHVPLNEETENLISKKDFDLMKKSVYLINTSRGKVVNENDLLEALQRKVIAGAATDVLSNELSFGEGQNIGNKLIDYAKEHDNLLIAPHIGGMTTESAVKTRVFIANKLKEATKGV